MYKCPVYFTYFTYILVYGSKIPVHRVDLVCRSRSDLSVGEKEDGVLVLNAGHVVELLQIVVEGRVVVAATEFDLETLAAANV